MFSGKRSLTNHNEKYLTILKSVNYVSKERVRFKIKFKILSESKNYPTLYMVHKKVDKNTLVENEISKTLANIGGDNCVIKFIKNSEWIEFEGYLWLEPNVDSTAYQNLSAYLFFDNTDEYFIDDLEIQIEEF
jgi:SUMO ligase MMS21 Smc5/6 complex component